MAAAGGAPPGTQLWLGNLPKACSALQVQSLAPACIDVLVFNRPNFVGGVPVASAILTFGSAQAAEAGLQALNGRILGGGWLLLRRLLDDHNLRWWPR